VIDGGSWDDCNGVRRRILRSGSGVDYLSGELSKTVGNDVEKLSVGVGEIGTGVRMRRLKNQQHHNDGEDNGRK